MARKKANRPALTGADRVRKCRKRKKLILNQNHRINEYLVQIEQSDLNVAAKSNETQKTREPQIEDNLRVWANEHRISKRALNGLLSVLRSNGISSLPKNYRTLQETPVNIEIVRTAGGQLFHNGLRNCITNIFSTVTRDITINLKFNIDGLPLYKSSKISFWPILASIAGMWINSISIILCLLENLFEFNS